MADNTPPIIPVVSPTNTETQVAVILTKLEYIATDLTDLKHSVEGKYVTKEEFYPVKKVVYFVAGLVIASVVTAVLALVIRGK